MTGGRPLLALVLFLTVSINAECRFQFDLAEKDGGVPGETTPINGTYCNDTAAPICIVHCTGYRAKGDKFNLTAFPVICNVSRCEKALLPSENSTCTAIKPECDGCIEDQKMECRCNGSVCANPYHLAYSLAVVHYRFVRPAHVELYRCSIYDCKPRDIDIVFMGEWRNESCSLQFNPRIAFSREVVDHIFHMFLAFMVLFFAVRLFIAPIMHLFEQWQERRNNQASSSNKPSADREQIGAVEDEVPVDLIDAYRLKHPPRLLPLFHCFPSEFVMDNDELRAPEVHGNKANNRGFVTLTV